jgi:hypothetical protein
LKIILTVLLVYLPLSITAQFSQVNYNNSNSNKFTGIKDENKNNIVKLNLSSLVFKNFSLQYERVIDKNFSAALSFGYMPETSIPFKKMILNKVGNDTVFEKVIENFKLSNFQITPEFRIYLSKKGYGQGFYIAPYYRYARTTTKDIIFDYQEDDGTTNSVNLSGKLNSNTFGIMFGAQWLFKYNITLDWWILGFSYGTCKGSYTGTSERKLTVSEQADLKLGIESLGLPMVDYSVEVFEDGATLNVKGPFASLRSGLILGIRF